MKRIVCVLAGALVLPLHVPAQDPHTIAEFEALLSSVSEAHKSDQDVATVLKDVKLTEQLTQAEVNKLAPLVPGPYSTEQMYVLQGRTAWLAPPAGDLPRLADPDSATQGAILSRVVEYMNSTYFQIPHMLATKSISRFQDGDANMQMVNSGATNRMSDTNVRMFEPTVPYLRFIDTRHVAIENERGVETRTNPKEDIQWGLNGKISEGGPAPPLSSIVIDGVVGGKLSWVRWERIASKMAGVFAFSVEKKKSRYRVEYCCFPTTQSVGTMNNLMGDVNFQTATNWKPFQSTTGYHGTIYVDPDTGVVLRLVSQAELKPSDFVHQEDLRIDYLPVKIGDRVFYLPGTSYQWTEMVPFGDSYTRRFAVRHTLLISDYKEYRIAH